MKESKRTVTLKTVVAALRGAGLYPEGHEAESEQDVVKGVRQALAALFSERLDDEGMAEAVVGRLLCSAPELPEGARVKGRCIALGPLEFKPVALTEGRVGVRIVGPRGTHGGREDRIISPEQARCVAAVLAKADEQ